ncbi:MAG: hypothetical protein ABSA47_16695 [Verrucomicrobiota bacterium]|jgi:hypothetical protein
MKVRVFRANASPLLLAVDFCLFAAATVSAQNFGGPLTPPPSAFNLGAPGPTMTTLAYIEPRTPITNVPPGGYQINTSGSYYLTANLTVSSGDAIDINASGVTLDLNGFNITSDSSPASGTAIAFSGETGNANITILNGHIVGGVYGGGTFFSDGPGFINGIAPTGSYFNGDINIHVSGVSVSGCYGVGIDLGYYYNSTIVESCTVSTVGGDGILAGIVSRCEAINCGGIAIYAFTASDSVGVSLGDGTTAISATIANNCFGEGEGNPGDGIHASIANGCIGDGNHDGYGIDAYIANSCNSYPDDSGIAYKYNMP